MIHSISSLTQNHPEKNGSLWQLAISRRCLWLPGAMVARLASIADGTKRLQVRVLRWSCFWVFKVEISMFYHILFFLVELEGSGRLPLMECSDLMLAYKYGRLAKWHRVWLRIRRLQVRPLRWSKSFFFLAFPSSCTVAESDKRSKNDHNHPLRSYLERR